MDNRSTFLSRLVTFDDGVTQKDKESHLMDGGWRVKAGSGRQIRRGLTVRLDTWPYGR
jgi:hypothetical protein